MYDDRVRWLDDNRADPGSSDDNLIFPCRFNLSVIFLFPEYHVEHEAELMPGTPDKFLIHSPKLLVSF